MATAKTRARARDDDDAVDASTTAPSLALSTAKLQRVDDDDSRGRAPAHESAAVAQVFAVQLLTHRMLAALDAASAVRFASFLRARAAWRHVLQDERLWRELLAARFGGPVRMLPPAPTEADGYSDADLSDDDDEDEDDDGQGRGEESGDDDDGDDGDGAGNGGRWRQRATTRPAPPAAAPTAPAEVLQLHVPPFACQSLVHFARSSRQRQRFEDAVHVIAGDIGTIAQINGRAIDGIAFATGGYLRNPSIGVANVVFQRAGRALDQHVNEISVGIDSGQVYVTPGFAAGVDKLIHCAGPIYMGGRGVPLLALVYENVLQAAVRENLSCVAMTSISTGNLGFPLREAASTGLRALQRFIREHAWPGTIAIVCYETEVFNEFTQQRQLILDAFNAV